MVKAPINPESAVDTRRKNFLTEAEIESFLKAVPIDPCLLFAC